ncbi:folliculin-interacting protein 2 [Hetaerina americana]|uniref:folliculin-interacting protein 2 n=1 Tax=Hetaerina americana TaxID=62018 RepID=UPI003A7F368D
MALLNRLFSTRKRNPKYSYALNGKYEGESWRPFVFNREQVRVLLFRECDWRGRKLLFDSSMVVKASNEKSSRSKLKFGGRPKVDAKYLSTSNGSYYQQTKPSADVSMLGEMIFGSVGMTFKGSAFKVHRMKSSSQLMCSKVFLSPRCHRKHLSSERSLDDSCDSSLNGLGEPSVPRSSSDNRLNSSRTGPLDVPWNDTYSTLYPPGSSYAQPSEGDSGFCGDTSLLSANCSNSSGYGFSSGGGTSWGSFGQPIDPPSSHGSGSLQSMQRRWLRSLHTSIELFCQSPSVCACSSGPANALCLSGNPSADGLDDNSQASSAVATLWGRRPKLGLAIIVTLLDPLKEQQSVRVGLSEKEDEEKLGRESFFFEHILVVEEMLDRLRLATEKACHSRKEIFIPLIMDACAELEQSMLDLFCGPRLSRPVWLGLLGQNGVGGLHHSTIALGFLEQLCQSLSSLDTKATNFFISTLVTAVLTHHLGWVHTVQPPLSSKKQNSTSGNSLEGLANSHPYNALWAQLGDLQGNLGYPPRLARTILVGKDVQVLNSLLFILTYFLRCSRVECMHEDGPVEAESSPIVLQLKLQRSQVKQSASKGSVIEAGVKGGCPPQVSALSTLAGIPQTSSTAAIIHHNDKVGKLVQAIGSDEKAASAPPKGMRRTQSHVSGLVSEASLNDKGQEGILQLDAISEKVKRLCRVPKSAIEYHLTPAASLKSICDKNASLATADGSDVVFVLGENERLVGLKKRAASDDVTTAEEAVVERTCRTERGGPGRVALGDQITALAGEFLSRCKEGIRLAGRAADSIGVVGGQATLRVGKVVHYCPEGPEIPKTICDIRAFNGVIGHVEDPFHSKSVNGSVYKNGRVDFLNEISTFHCGAQRALTRSCNSRECRNRTQVSPEVMGAGVGGHEGLGRVSPSVKWSLETRTAECNGVEELVQGMGPSGHKMDSQKGVLGRVWDVYSLVNTSALPSFEEVATVELPMPKSVSRETKDEDCKCGLGCGLASSLLGATTDHYIPHMVLQGIACSSSSASSGSWENRLRRDLALSVQHPVHHFQPCRLQEFLCSPYPVVAEPDVVEAVCVVGNTDTWEVQVVSSRSCLVDRPGTLGVRVGMSQLVANMLESLLILWRLRTPPEYCLLHLESKLREIWLRSHSLAQLLLTTEFCNMARVTTSLDLEANDVPLLLAVASTHTPQVTLRYGLSFR